MMVSFVASDNPDAVARREKALAVYEQVKAWPYWEEVYRNCVKESPMSYEAFAQAVQVGDGSQHAFDQAMQASQMTREQFARYLPAFQQFVTLCAIYPNVSMLSDGANQIWHAFMLITDRYAQFCQEVIGQMIEHLPCSLYELSGVTPPQTTSNCVSSCLPSTCSGNGGGGGCTKSKNRDTADPASIAQSIRSSRITLDLFQNPPSWFQATRQVCRSRQRHLSVVQRQGFRPLNAFASLK